MNNPEISVLLPVRNGGELITAALDSIAKQTFTDFECIIIDDGSTDDTPSLIDDFAGCDNRFKVFHRSAEGIVAALNFGLGRCSGNFIARMDGDDISHPSRFEKQLAFLQSNPEFAVVGCLVTIVPTPDPSSGMFHYEQWINSVIEPDDIAGQMFIESPLPHPGTMIRLSTLDKLRGWRQFDGPEDYDMWLRMHAAGMKIGKVPEILLDWRDTSQRASRIDPRYSQEAFVNLKAHYLARDPRLASGKIQIWGAGRTGKTFAKALKAQGVGILRFIDINPRKIGQTASGAPVIAPDDLPRYKNDFIIGAVGGRGARGARDEIRSALSGMGFVEGENFLFVA